MNTFYKLVIFSAAVLIVTSLPAYAAEFPNTSRTAPSGIAPIKLTLSGQRVEQSSPAVADFDNDGDKEIVIGGEDGMLYVAAYDGSSWSVVWSRQVADDLNAADAPTTCADRSRSDIRSAPSIADLDGDGKLEIVVTTGGDPGRTSKGGAHRNGGVLVYKYNRAWDFSVASGWPQPQLDIIGQGAGASNPDGCWDGIWSAAVLADITGDGKLEVVVNGFDRRIHAWHQDGTKVSGWPKNEDNLEITRGGWSTPAVADLDGDGQNEVIVGTDNVTVANSGQYKLFAFEGNGKVMTGFPVIGTQNFHSSPAIGDINGDGKLDIVVGSGTYESSGGNKVYAWDSGGNLLAGWPQSTDWDMPASPALGDLDGDGDLEIVIGCGKEADPFDTPRCTKLYAWHGNGSPVSGFPMTPANANTWPGAIPTGMARGPVLADYDGDGEVEILVNQRGSWGISIVENNGDDATPRREFDLSSNTLNGSLVVDDVDGDGKLEIVTGGATSDGANGSLFIWDATGSANAPRPWPMLNQNAARTGTSLDDEVTIDQIPPPLIMHDPRDGRQASSQFLIQSNGRGTFMWTIRHTIQGLTVTPNSGTSNSSAVVRLDYTVPTGSAMLALGQRETLGQLTFQATDTDGNAIEGGMQTIDVNFISGQLSRIHLPAISR